MKAILAGLALASCIVGIFCEKNLRKDTDAASTSCSGTCDLCVSRDKSGSVQFQSSLNSDSGTASACGSFSNTISSTGWGELHVRTNEKAKDAEQAWAAGFIEGYLTQTQILQFYHNTASERSEAVNKKLEQFVDAQKAYIKREVSKSRADAGKKRYWHHIGLLYAQLQGIEQGYNSRATKEGAERLSSFALWIINMDGDIIQLETAISKDVLRLPGANVMAFKESSREAKAERRANVASSDPWADRLLNTLSHENGLPDTQLPITAQGEPKFNEKAVASWKQHVEKQRCSALVKLTADQKDLFVGHTSWEDYTEMLRIFKHFDTRFQGQQSQVSFSSYPGMLASTDDFYMTNNKLVITETTLSILDDQALTRMKADAIGSWMATVLASRLAKTGEEWADLFIANNAGTYSCQWMILDYSKVGTGEAADGLFWMVENIPGLAKKKDMTKTLFKTGYWQSANRPYFSSIRAAAGYGESDRMTSFNDNPRARIFGRLQNQVTSIDKMKWILRFNGYPNEKESNGDPSLTVSARYDLDPKKRTLTGAVDGKVVCAADVQHMRVNAISGPTTEDEPAFTWLETDRHHEGMPSTFNFDWIVTIGGKIDGSSPTSQAAAEKWLCKCHSL